MTDLPTIITGLRKALADWDALSPPVTEAEARSNSAVWNNLMGLISTVETIRLLLDKLIEMDKALKPFADVSGEGDEDYPSETKVTAQFGRSTHYALTLGDLRRAAHVHIGIE